MPSSPIQDIEFGDALNLSLDNYYDIIKTNVGGLGAQEFLQLKTVADPVAISPDSVSEENPEGFRWHSYYNLLVRSDIAIDPSPVTNQVHVGAAKFVQVYGAFLQKLRGFVVRKELSAEDQGKLADLDRREESTLEEMNDLVILDRMMWIEYAVALGKDPGSNSDYVQWSNVFGKRRRISEKFNSLKRLQFDRKTILDKQYADPSDRAIIDTEFNFENPFQRLRYPFFPDYEYDDGELFSASYLAQKDFSSTAVFDDRRAINWQLPISEMTTTQVGAFEAILDEQTGESKSIKTDWSASASARYGFIKVKASAQESRRIQEDFRKAKRLKVSAQASFRANINYAAWFDPTLFEHRYVKENPAEFMEFFGNTGSLRYYPTALILVRGFSIEFNSDQDWQYDYESKFSASGGGGFGAFGISFGGSASYSKHVKEHEFDQSNTDLKISDGENNIRFIGYAVKENTVFDEEVTETFAEFLED